MAFLQHDQRSGRYRIRFRFEGQEYKRSIRTANEREANAILGRVEETIILIERGRLEVPHDVDPASFILSDGKRNGKSRNGQLRTVRDLFDRYEKSIQDGVKEPTTRKTERIHLGHLGRLLKTSQPLVNVTVGDVQAYIDRRLKEKSAEKNIRPDTAKKEVATLRAVWNWALSQELVSIHPPTKGLRYPKRDEKPPFMTWDEIARRLARGGLTDEEERELWGALFLTKEQVHESLEYARDKAHHQFIFPMLVFTAHTGARCSEVLRSQIDDFDFSTSTVRIREKKKSRSRSITFRHVPLTALLAQTMQDYFASHPGGQFSIAKETGEELNTDEARHYFKQVFAKSKWKRLKGFHVYRHSFASNLAAAGVDQRMIDEWMGHQTEEMRRRYRHLFPDQQRQAIDLVFGTPNSRETC